MINLTIDTPTPHVTHLKSKKSSTQAMGRHVGYAAPSVETGSIILEIPLRGRRGRNHVYALTVSPRGLNAKYVALNLMDYNFGCQLDREEYL